MINTGDILETIGMIQNEHLDIRTITMGISLLDCCSGDIDVSCTKIYDKITRLASKLVKTGEDIEKEYGIPIINKRISVTPIAMILASSGGDPVKYALTLEKASREVGVNFIGGYSALVQKGFAQGDEALIRSIPEALSRTDHICSSVNIGSTKQVSIWMPSSLWVTLLKTQHMQQKTAIVSVLQSLLFSATHPMTTPLWQVHSTAQVKQTA